MKAKGIPADADVIIGFSFGFEREPGNIRPGISNEVIADAVFCWGAAGFEKGGNWLPKIVQWEIARCLRSLLSVKEINQHSIVGKYLDTREVAAQATEFMKSQGWKTALVIAHPGHIRRCVWELERLGVSTIVPQGLKKIPYNPQSVQWWTRNKFFWWLREIPLRILLVLRSYFDLRY